MESYSTMVRSGGGLVCWCRFVSGCRLVSRSGCCISTVLNISNISVVSINSVSYSLGTAVREENVIFSIGYSAISAIVKKKLEWNFLKLAMWKQMGDFFFQVFVAFAEKLNFNIQILGAKFFTWIHFDQSWHLRSHP